MSSLESEVEKIESKLPKVIDSTVHGIIDYAHTAFFFTVGLCCLKFNKPAAAAAFAVSGFILAEALLTDYRLGVEPVIPFETHGSMDAVFAATSWLMPRLFGFQGTTAARIFEVNSAVESTVVALTDWNSERAHMARIES